MDLGDSITKINESGGDIADVIFIPSGGIPALVEKGYLHSITEGFDTFKVDLPASAISAVELDGVAYGVPFSPNSFFMFYNKSFYSEDEVKSLETMMNKDFGPGKYNFSTCITNSWYTEMFFLGNGCTLYGEDGKDPTDCTFNNEKGIEAAEYIIDLANNPKYLDDSLNGGEEFKAGNVGAYTTGAWSAPDFKEALGDNLCAAPLPTVKIAGNDVQLSNFIDFKIIVVNQNTAHAKAAEQLAIYLANRDSSLRRFENYGEIPVLQSLANDEVISNDYSAMALNAQANFSTNQPNIPQMDNYWGPMADFGTAVVEGKVDKTNVLEHLNTMVTSILVEVPVEEEETSDEASDEEPTEEETEEVVVDDENDTEDTETVENTEADDIEETEEEIDVE